MVTVDSRGRIVLPRDIRKDLGIVPGTEVEVRVEDGKAVVEPTEDPDRIIDRLEQLVSKASADCERIPGTGGKTNQFVEKHEERIRREARKKESGGGSAPDP